MADFEDKRLEYLGLEGPPSLITKSELAIKVFNCSVKELETEYSYEEYQQGVALLKVRNAIEAKVQQKAEKEAEAQKRQNQYFQR